MNDIEEILRERKAREAAEQRAARLEKALKALLAHIPLFEAQGDREVCIFCHAEAYDYSAPQWRCDHTAHCPYGQAVTALVAVQASPNID